MEPQIYTDKHGFLEQDKAKILLTNPAFLISLYLSLSV